jgi:hypothetical protein
VVSMPILVMNMIMMGEPLKLVHCRVRGPLAPNGKECLVISLLFVALTKIALTLASGPGCYALGRPLLMHANKVLINATIYIVFAWHPH